MHPTRGQVAPSFLVVGAAMARNSARQADRWLTGDLKQPAFAANKDKKPFQSHTPRYHGSNCYSSCTGGPLHSLCKNDLLGDAIAGHEVLGNLLGGAGEGGTA